MTLIAHYNAFGTPTLLGDLLVSSKEKPATEVHIPASRNINERIFRPNFYIAGLAQKIVLFNNRLAIAWAGNFDRAADFVSSLQPFRNVEKEDPDYIKDMLNAVAQEDKGRLSWLVLVSDGSGSRLFTRGVTRPRQYGNVSEVVCGGTGTARFQLMFSQLCRNVRPIAPGHATDDGFTASVISAALGEEIDRPLHLLEGWGGGFEAVRLVGGNLIRLGSQLSLNFFAAPGKTRSDWRLWFVPIFRHIEYWNDRTVAQSVEHRVDQKGNILPGRRDVFIVSSPGAEAPDLSTFSVPALEAHSMVQVFVNVDRRPKTMTYAAAYALPVIFYKDPPQSMTTTIYVDPALIRDVIEGLQKGLQKPVTYSGFRNMHP